LEGSALGSKQVLTAEATCVVEAYLVIALPMVVVR
jgi:hypothetical protein